MLSIPLLLLSSFGIELLQVFLLGLFRLLKLGNLLIVRLRDADSLDVRNNGNGQLVQSHPLNLKRKCTLFLLRRKFEIHLTLTA